MKKLANGTFKLALNERQIGNYIIKDGDSHMKVQDIGGIFQVSLSKRMPIGVWLHNIFLMKEKGDPTLHTYIGTLFSALSVAPDDDYVKNLLDQAYAAIQRHPDWYGDAFTTEEGKSDEEIIQEERELSEFIEKVKATPDKDETITAKE